MQRVRIGLTGLASVFLAVLLAAVFTGRARHEAAPVQNSVAPTGPGAANQSAPAEEPLATLGLTPSNSDSNGSGQTAPNAPPTGRR